MGSQGSNPENPATSAQPPVPVEFQWTEPCQQVYVCGSFNNWKDRMPLVQVKANLWKVTKELSPGTYQFKFIVDSAWRCSQEYKTVRDGANNVNNVIVVEAMREEDAEQKQRMEEIEKLFNTTIPENPCAIWNNYPTELPRQLVKTPLNASLISKEFQPSVLLPLPDHVVLTHFFRQRKRKNYSVTSSTCRYRGKYVTVVLYTTTDFEGNEEVPELVNIFNQAMIL
ncbi:5'-AMP-activated_protein kinase [Hexamita inflata]|uniref:Beta subunit n=1 Tax=Hexamita inflata TaxID=28002 RepID=A0AA86NLI5_9EUKA|nr:5'-AMP-activated protein kinase [Hexamita inflata]CAI9923459.1 5'-AMP-activated protein kinase [Hexamita inflata]CAI9965776.1 5'-AMP-activated protein kinase [Hexamita inflata]